MEKVFARRFRAARRVEGLAALHRDETTLLFGRC
jgi:hypothetical protein